MGAAEPRPRVFVSRGVMPAGVDRLATVADVDAWAEPLSPPRSELLRRVAGCTGILVVGDRVDDELLDAAGPALCVVAQYGVGHDNIDVAACTRRGVAATNTPGALSETTADMAWALLMAAARRITEGERLVRAGGWPRAGLNDLLGLDVGGATIGIVGLGRIGQAVARRAKGFGMTILYTQRHRADRAVEAEVGAIFVPLDELLSKADFITLHAPLTPQTEHLIDAVALGRMKREAILVNTARGAIVDQDALIAALDAGRIRAAALDVTVPEPLPADHPLVGRDDVLVVPHVGSATQATRTRMALLCAESIIAGIRGEPVPRAIDPGYRRG
jgi:lactate dehydrogenase-like 2-hydroxyacid dehydrogenase